MVGTRQGFKDVSRNIATALMVTGLVVGNPHLIALRQSCPSVSQNYDRGCRFSKLIIFRRGGALFGIRDQGGEARIGMKRVEIGLIFDF
jgi:hypothetical protein